MFYTYFNFTIFSFSFDAMFKSYQCLFSTIAFIVTYKTHKYAWWPLSRGSNQFIFLWLPNYTDLSLNFLWRIIIWCLLTITIRIAIAIEMKRFVLPALLSLEYFSLTFVSNLEEIKVHETQEEVDEKDGTNGEDTSSDVKELEINSED